MEDVFEKSGRVNESLFIPSGWQALLGAMNEATVTRADHIRTPHLFMGLLVVEDVAIQAWGTRLNADLSKLRDQFQELFAQPQNPDDFLLRLHREFMSDQVIFLLRAAFKRCREHGRKLISPMDILVSILVDSDSIVTDCFERVGVTAALLTEQALLAETAVAPTSRAA